MEYPKVLSSSVYIVTKANILASCHQITEVRLYVKIPHLRSEKKWADKGPDRNLWKKKKPNLKISRDWPFNFYLSANNISLLFAVLCLFVNRLCLII